ncbi:hypothetical protein [Burkholderia sp. SIMBA_062]|uniref:hypothetical protein n=1 Tax=Burkholderia sp. SIMBA_062 TaxID=3085803 RepID=UPI00397D7222
MEEHHYATSTNKTFIFAVVSRVVDHRHSELPRFPSSIVLLLSAASISGSSTRNRCVSFFAGLEKVEKPVECGYCAPKNRKPNAKSRNKPQLSPCANSLKRHGTREDRHRSNQNHEQFGPDILRQAAHATSLCAFLDMVLS